jgi:hypothetical protein
VRQPSGGVRRVQAPGRITQPPLRVGIAPAPRSGLMSAGILGVAHRRDALDRGGPWIVDDQVLEGHDAQPTANHVEQFARSEKELRPCRSPKALVSDRERLVEQGTRGTNRRDQLIQEGPVQVVRDHHPCEPSLAERERLTALEVHLDYLESIVFPDVIETRDVSIDGDDVVPLVQ